MPRRMYYLCNAGTPKLLVLAGCSELKIRSWVENFETQTLKVLML
jgi:hypothetical protein